MQATKMRYLPDALTTLRCGLALPIYLLLLDYQLLAGLLLIGAALVTDVLDGWLARRLAVCSTRGAYFDAGADLLVICAGFAALVRHDVYPVWLLVVFLLMFAHFVLTSTANQVIYDPIGKYYGAVLYSVLIALLILPDVLFSYALLILVLSLTVISVVQRWAVLLRRTRPKPMP